MFYKSLALLVIISSSIIPLAFAQSLDFEEICSQVSDETPIIVTTDMENYDRGNTINVYGCLAEKAQTKGINIIVYDPNGDRIASSTLVPNTDGTFSEEFITDEQFPSDGTYSVEVDAAGLYTATKTFTVPEFGTMSILVLSVGLVGAIYFLRNKFSKFQIHISR